MDHVTMSPGAPRPDRPARTADRRATLCKLAGLAGMVAGLAGPAAAQDLSIDRLLVEKGKRRLTLYSGTLALRSFRVALGRTAGPKVHEGDGRTPEGTYAIDGVRETSQFYRALHISYPSLDDVERAQAMGRSAGGQVMIHGLDPAIAQQWREEHWKFNWTRGCIAVTDAEMDILMASVRLGTPVEIRA